MYFWDCIHLLGRTATILIVDVDGVVMTCQSSRFQHHQTSSNPNQTQILSSKMMTPRSRSAVPTPNTDPDPPHSQTPKQNSPLGLQRAKKG